MPTPAAWGRPYPAKDAPQAITAFGGISGFGDLTIDRPGTLLINLAAHGGGTILVLNVDGPLVASDFIFGTQASSQGLYLKSR